MIRMIIVSADDAARDQLARLLVSSGFSVYRSCSSGSALRRALAESEDSIVLFAGQLRDCKPDELVWDYGDRVRVLLIAKPAVLDDCESPEIFRLALPTGSQTIIGALEMLSQLHRMRMPRRKGEEKETVEKAKQLLMKQYRISEPEAHHLLQKYAMDHGQKMIECAERILKQASG